MHHVHVIVYASRQLKPPELKYPIHDLELAVIVFALKIQIYYLYGETFYICINRKSLKCLFSQFELNIIWWIWLDFLKDYEIIYQPGNTSVIVDALS